MREKWSNEEISFLKENYGKLTSSEMMDKLPKRSRSSICNKVRELGIVYKLGHNPVSHRRDFSEEELLNKRREYSKLRCRDIRIRDPRYTLFSNAKHRAKINGVEFSITIDDIVVPEKCPVFNIPLRKGIGVTEVNSPSLDRKDPNKGYSKDNVWVISHKANRLKNNASLEDLKILVSALEAHLK